MGREVEQEALGRGHDILARIDQPGDWAINAPLLSRCDVVIDFSMPAVAPATIMNCFERNIPVVTGTTGWYDRLEEIRERCILSGQTLFVSANFSIGVNILLDLVARASRITEMTGGYKASIREVHHIHKLDAPSGTAIRLADRMIENSTSLKRWTAGTSGGMEDIPVTSLREGEVMGVHSVRFESMADIIELTHEAKSRKGFASGAVTAAEWVQGKKGFFEMKDLLSFKD